MRIKPLILLVLILCVAVSACGSHSGADGDIEIKLDVNAAVYDVEEYFSGASTVYALNDYVFTQNGRSLRLTIYDEGQYFSPYLMGYMKRSFEEYIDGENVFYYRISEPKFDDATVDARIADKPFKMDIVLLSVEGYDIVLMVDIPGSQKDPAEMISLLKAILAGNEVEGLELTRHDIRARLTDGLFWIGIGTQSDDLQAHSGSSDSIMFMKDENLYETDGIRYYLESGEQDQDDNPNYRSVYCRTDQGYFHISCHVGYEDRDKVTPDDCAFVDYPLAEKLARHLGITIVSFE